MLMLCYSEKQTCYRRKFIDNLVILIKVIVASPPPHQFLPGFRLSTRESFGGLSDGDGCISAQVTEHEVPFIIE